MRILLATPLYPPDLGGPALEAVLLEKELPKQGIEVIICSFGSVRHLPKGIRHLAYFFRLLLWAKASNGIVAIDTFSVCLPAALAAHILHKPLIVRVPGEFAWEQGVQRFGVTDSIETFQQKRYGLALESIRMLQRWSVKSATLVVVCSDFLKSIVAQWGVSPEKLVRIYLGFNFMEEIVLPKHIPEGKIIFSAGRFVPWKGFLFLIELLPTLSEKWHLVIAGEGPLRNILELKVRELALGKRVLFTGSIPHAEVLGWCKTANVFALNTSYETFSFQIIEAMASGIPVITTSVSSIPELITNGIEGVLCIPNDTDGFAQAIISTETQPELWKKRTVAAQQKSKEFPIRTSIETFVALLKKICE